MGNLLSNLLAMSVAGSVVVGLLLLLRPVTAKIFPAKWQYRIGKMAIAFFLIPVSLFARKLSWVQPVIQNYHSETPITQSVTQTALPSSSFMDTVDAMMEKNLSVEVVQVILFVWFAGAIVFVLWHFYCYRRFSKQLRENSMPVPENTAAVLLSSCKAALGIHNDVKLMQNRKIVSPMLVGLFHPMILLPTSNMPEIDLKLVLTHELMHLKRKDIWVKMLALIAGMLHWFNPFVHVLRKDVSTWGELSCDEVMASEMSHEQRKLYGEAILNTLDNHSGINTAFCSSLCESKKHIERRLAMLLNVKKTKKHIAVFAAIAILAIGGTATVLAASAASNTSYDDSQLITTKAGATIIPSSVDFGTRMDIELNKDSILLIGRETWEKGDEIVFRVSADEDMALSVGILPAENMDSGFEYDDYGQFVHKRLDDVNSDVQEALFIVPETGEYGIGVQHISYEVDSAVSAPSTPKNKEQSGDANNTAASAPQSVENETVSFKLEINKVFKNPLVK